MAKPKQRVNPYLFEYQIEWLKNQNEDMSVTIRKLIDEAIEKEKEGGKNNEKRP